MTLDKYQIYSFWKVLKKMWGAKRFNTATFNTFFETDLEEYLINMFINDNYHVEYMSNYAINLVNEFNCNVTNIYEWTIYVLNKAIIDNEFPDLKDVNSINKLKNYKIFSKRKAIDEQINFINKIIEERNSGLGELTSDRFSLFEINELQVNEAYTMFKNKQIEPEFYIRGFEAKKFDIDFDIIKDIDYKRFITFAKIIIKIKQEYTEKNKANN